MASVTMLPDISAILIWCFTIVQTIVKLLCEGNFNPMDNRRLAIPIRFGKGVAMVAKLLAKMGALNTYWNQQLKKLGDLCITS